jgi:hypothetical protein
MRRQAQKGAVVMAHTLLALIGFAALPLFAASNSDQPRLVSPAERAAVAALAGYLTDGAPAVLEVLAPRAPLKKLDRAQALREIEARLGPREKSEWSLQTVVPSLRDRAAAFGVIYPSGADDTVVFEMERSGEAWLVRSIRTSGEPVPPAAALPPAMPRPSDPLRSAIDLRVGLAAALPAALLGALAVVLHRSRRGLAALLAVCSATGLAGGAAVVTLLAIPSRPGPAAAATPVRTLPAFVPLADLVPLRSALAAGDATALRNAWGTLPHGDARDVASLWKLQLNLLGDQHASVEREVANLPWGRQTPLAQLLRARAAFLGNRMADTVLAYESALGTGPGRDALLLEIGGTLASLGFDDRAKGYLQQAAKIGSREPLVYYSSSVLAALDGDAAAAEKNFLTAWTMQPVPRDRVLGMAVLWQVLRKPEVASRLRMDSAEEARFASPSTAPLTLGVSTEAEVVGDCLLLRAGGSQLRVPGGAAIAPAGAIVRDADAWQRREEAEVLADYEAIRARASTTAALADPQLRRRLLVAAGTLVDRNRWTDVIQLTDAFSARDERVPIELMVDRGYALARARRPDELRNLIAGLLQNPVVRRRRDPAVMIAIADLLGAVDKWDAAAAMLTRVQRELDLPGIDQRIEQLMIEKALAQNYQVVKTEHFDIHFPPKFSAHAAERAGQILESEYVRLRRQWLPGLEMRRTKVNLLWWEDFQDYAGSDYIAGLYTDEIFLPMAGIDTFIPEIVAIMSHELFHAMLAGATNDLAPRWFQEAFASRVEMLESKRNAFQHYRDERFVSVAMLDAVANESPDPEMVGSAYEIGESTLRFVQAKWGMTGLQRLVREFAAGRRTEEAIPNAFGVPVSELDRLARAWGATQPPLFTGGEVVRYDGYVPPRGTVSGGEERFRW